MAFFENLGKKVGEAAQNAAKKSGELVEITKLNLSVNGEEQKITKLYQQIGQKMYACYLSGEEADRTIEDDCRAISEHESEIKRLKEKILEVKNVKVCTGCGAEMERTAMFCAKCGAKVPNGDAAAEKPAERYCQSCGAKLNDGSAFCSGCGAKATE